MAFVIQKPNQGKKVNIDGSDDMFYRYKVDQLVVQQIGHDKMVKTMLVNLDDFATGLKTKSEYILVYLGFELSTKSGCDKQGQPYIAGHQNISQVCKVIKKFIWTFILCDQCKLPEVNLCNKKRIMLKCNGCGAYYPPDNINEKFEKYLFKQCSNKSIVNGKSEIINTLNHNEIEFSTDDLQRTELYMKNQTDIIWESDFSTEARQKRKQELLPDTAASLLAKI